MRRGGRERREKRGQLFDLMNSSSQTLSANPSANHVDNISTFEEKRGKGFDLIIMNTINV